MSVLLALLATSTITFSGGKPPVPIDGAAYTSNPAGTTITVSGTVIPVTNGMSISFSSVATQIQTTANSLSLWLDFGTSGHSYITIEPNSDVFVSQDSSGNAVVELDTGKLDNNESYSATGPSTNHQALYRTSKVKIHSRNGRTTIGTSGTYYEVSVVSGTNVPTYQVDIFHCFPGDHFDNCDGLTVSYCSIADTLYPTATYKLNAAQGGSGLQIVENPNGPDTFSPVSPQS